MENLIEKKKSGYGVACLVLGIVAFISSSLCFFLGIMFLILPILAVVPAGIFICSVSCGIVTLADKKCRRSDKIMSIIGLVIVVSLVPTFFILKQAGLMILVGM